MCTPKLLIHIAYSTRYLTYHERSTPDMFRHRTRTGQRSCRWLSMTSDSKHKLLKYSSPLCRILEIYPNVVFVQRPRCRLPSLYVTTAATPYTQTTALSLETTPSNPIQQSQNPDSVSNANRKPSLLPSNIDTLRARSVPELRANMMIRENCTSKTAGVRVDEQGNSDEGGYCVREGAFQQDGQLKVSSRQCSNSLAEIGRASHHDRFELNDALNKKCCSFNISRLEHCMPPRTRA